MKDNLKSSKKDLSASVDEKTIEKLVAKRDELKRSLTMLMEKIERDRGRNE